MVIELEKLVKEGKLTDFDCTFILGQMAQANCRITKTGNLNKEETQKELEAQIIAYRKRTHNMRQQFQKQTVEGYTPSSKYSI